MCWLANHICAARDKHQGMKTPGRRGEQIKHEEIDKEIVRRYTARREKEKKEEKNDE